MTSDPANAGMRSPGCAINSPLPAPSCLRQGIQSASLERIQHLFKAWMFRKLWTSSSESKQNQSHRHCGCNNSIRSTREWVRLCLCCRIPHKCCSPVHREFANRGTIFASVRQSTNPQHDPYLVDYVYDLQVTEFTWVQWKRSVLLLKKGNVDKFRELSPFVAIQL